MSVNRPGTTCKFTLAAILCIGLLPALAAAQTWDITGKIGVGIPVGTLSDSHDAGLGLSLATTRWFGPRIGLRFGGAANMLGGSTSNIPDLTFWHYDVGPEFDLVHSQEHKLTVHANAGLGGTTAQAKGGSSATDLTLNFGLNVEYPLNEYFRLIGGPALYLIFAEKTEAILPITVGFRYLFSR